MKAEPRIIPLLLPLILSPAFAAGPEASPPKAAGATGMEPPGARQTGNPNLETPVVPPLIIIAPTEVRTDPTLAQQC